MRRKNLSADFFKNNDINFTSSYLHVDFSIDNMFQIHVGTHFWKFMLKQGADRKVRSTSQIGI